MPSLFDCTDGRVSALKPGDTIGIVGGGQLGRMMALAAKYMGLRIGVLDPTPDCPTAQVADFQITAQYDNRAAIAELAERSDVLTYEFENVDADALDAVADRVAIPQGTELLRVTQNRIREKSFINALGIETAPWCAVYSREQVREAVQQLGFPCVLKTAEGGYDGHGQLVLRSEADIEQVWPDEDFPASIVEGFVDFACEASIMVTGDGKQAVTFPVVRNEHRNNILHMTIAPAGVDAEVDAIAHKLARTLAGGFALAGTLGIELFVKCDGTVLVNELAPRPHNSAHYTIEACNIDQFAAHIRGISGMPLPEPRLLEPAVMANILGQDIAAVQQHYVQHPQWFVHDYGKAEAKHNRKMGHITVLCADRNPVDVAADLESVLWGSQQQ